MRALRRLAWVLTATTTFAISVGAATTTTAGAVVTSTSSAESSDGTAWSGQVSYLPGLQVGGYVVTAPGAAVSMVRPTSTDAMIWLSPLGDTVVLGIDDVAAGTTGTVPVSVSQLGADARLRFVAAACVPVNTPWWVTGLEQGRPVLVSLDNAANRLPGSGRCRGVGALGGTIKFGGALFLPYDVAPWTSTPALRADGFARAVGCRVDAARLLPGESASCGFTATRSGGWRIADEGPGLFVGYRDDSRVRVTIRRGGSETTWRAECGTGLIEPEDRVLVTVESHESQYQQANVHAGPEQRCP
jgi:hypothetical protein